MNAPQYRIVVREDGLGMVTYHPQRRGWVLWRNLCQDRYGWFLSVGCSTREEARERIRYDLIDHMRGARRTVAVLPVDVGPDWRAR